MAFRTPLYDVHRALGARFVEFAGWDMPVSYAGMLEEHHAVRRCCGLFDVSHMGEIELRGPGARALCQRLGVNDVDRLRDGEGQYTLFCNSEGGVLDDLIVYRLAPERWLMIVNASNAPADLAWVREHAGHDVEVGDQSAGTGLLALQGPEAAAVLGTLTALDLAQVPPFGIRSARIAGIEMLVSRTGYTGEDGFELVVAAGHTVAAWEAVHAAVTRRGGMAAGLGARDTLRLEAALPLCGTDMDATTTPLEASLGWVVKLGKDDFLGRDALARQDAAGVPRRLVGIALDEPGIPRHGHAVFRDDERVGTVTSGTKSPTLGSFIGMGYVAASAAATGTSISVEIRGRRHSGRVVARPFYRRPRPEAGHADP
ncbi:MAG: glycine cleavage system aminomethyltransferase GcvT [bacterium]|nr:glycine cleavage system aminomethyltransferase GcvT [bacterium]